MYRIEKLEKMFEEFCIFLEFKTNGKRFISFREHPYIDAQENYKYEVRKIARERLNYLKWESNRFGEGHILDAIIKSIEIKDNNFVSWHDKYGPATKAHQGIYNLKNNELKVREFEEKTYSFFYDEIEDKDYFNYLLNEIGKRYSVLAYLFFLKNSDIYLPIATMYFDKLFNDLGVDLKTSQKCSWENYKEYLFVLGEIKKDIERIIDIDISLIDSHSFCWIVTSQMREEKEKNNWVPTDFEKDSISVIKSRKGQGKYRDGLLLKWNNISSFGEKINKKFLISSHIKPWRDCNKFEAIDVDNGLLLTPNYDLLFDSGYISFEYNGEILISDFIKEEELEALRIDKKVRIKEINSKLTEYLKYHRENIYMKNET